MQELTKDQLAEQDRIDNAIHAMLCAVSGAYLKWDIFAIGEVRERVLHFLHINYGIRVEYPSVPLGAEISCPACGSTKVSFLTLFPGGNEYMYQCVECGELFGKEGEDVE